MTSPYKLLKAWNLHPRKQLGQNFLADPSTAEMIVSRAALGPEDRVLEIGPGLGALTIPVARRVKRVVAVETDARVAGLLKTELAVNDLSNVEIVQADILKVPLSELLARDAAGPPWVVMANLPYNISSPVLFRLIAERRWIHRAILMFQKELAIRLTASPGSRDYGRVTAMLAYCAGTRTLAQVGARLFYPRPRVDSEVLEIRFKQTPDHPAADEGHLFRVIKAAFSHRRKTLKNALAGSGMQIPADAAEQALVASGIDPRRRAETLSVREFVALSDALLRPKGTAFP